MSLIRQIWLLLLVTLLLAFLGSFGVWMVSAKGYLETQLRLKNADNAQSLALSLTQQKGDLPAMQLAISAMFDTGFYQRIALKDTAGRTVYARETDTKVLREEAPAWFVEAMPVESEPGTAQVSDGWRALGAVEVISHPGFAHGQLWKGALKTAGWLLALGSAAAVVAALGVRAIRRPLDATVAQAQALMDRRFVTVSEPVVPELARVSRAMNAVVVRLKSLFDEQSVQVELLRQQAHLDGLTGLSHRRHFMAQLQTILTQEEGSGSGMLYLIRLVDLAGINRLLGHRTTDELLLRLARTLTEATSGIEGAACGRLNGGDFAVCLTTSDVSLPEAQYFADAIKRAFVEQAVSATVVVSAVHWSRGTPTQQLLAVADSALAKAEARGPYAVEVAELPRASVTVLGEDAWRQRLASALGARRAQLMSYPVLDRQLKLVHHECPLRIQLEPEGGYEPAAEWLPMALRCGLISQIDEMAVALALEQIGRDHEDRGVNLSPASLLDSGFVARLHALISATPERANSLWLEVAESAAVERFELVRELCKQLRPLGVRVGLEHAGVRLARIDNLFEAGLDYIKLDPSVVQGVAQDSSRAAYVAATTSMLHGLGLMVFAEGVGESSDIMALRQAGVDGVTGPAVRLQ